MICDWMTEHVKSVIRILSAFQSYRLLILNATHARLRFCAIVPKLLQVGRAARAVLFSINE
jgi:hypothetical protein